MSTLRSALDELRGEDVDRLTDGQLRDDFAELQRAARTLEAERLRRLAAVDRRGAFKDEGYLSASAWLVDRFREAPPTAGRELRMAAALEEMPGTREALADGELATSAVPLLMSARETSASRFEGAEPMLVDAARTLNPRDLSRTVAYWRQAADEEETLRDAERCWDRRHLHVSRTMFGMVRVDGDLDPETGQTLITALRAVQDSEARTGEPNGTRTPDNGGWTRSTRSAGNGSIEATALSWPASAHT